MELEMILKHSPFKSREELLEQFNKIATSTGTLAIIYNLKLLDDGRTELGKIRLKTAYLCSIFLLIELLIEQTWKVIRTTSKCLAFASTTTIARRRISIARFAPTCLYCTWCRA